MSVALPFGLRQVKLVPLTPQGVEKPGEAVFLPASRTFSFSEAEDYETLEGDDRRWASHGAGPVVEWELEGGGIDLKTWAVLSGGTVTESGGTTRFTKLVSDQRPYFNVYGRAVSDSGGDFHMVVFRCKADQGLEAAMENGSFLLTSASGTGFGEDKIQDAKLYDFLHNEAETPFELVTGKTSWKVTVKGTPTGGTYQLSVNGTPTAPIAHDADAAAVAAAVTGVSGITGITATGSGTGAITLTLSAAGTVALLSHTLTGGTAPTVEVV